MKASVNKLILIRYSPPNRYDEAPFNTECKVTREDEYDLYRQVSKNEYRPQWELMGTYEN
jgi:hypothetical protein